MSCKQIVGHAGVAFIALTVGLGAAMAQDTPPSENKGVKVGPPVSLDIAQQLDSTEGRQLRMRVVTIEPGGVVGLHTHNGRPGVAYIVQGTVTEHRGSSVFERKSGDSFTEDKDTTHWAENKGNTPAVIVAVDLFKP